MRKALMSINLKSPDMKKILILLVASFSVIINYCVFIYCDRLQKNN